MSGPDFFDRQKRIQGWNQKALSDSSVLIAGAGALGNEIIKNLALAGVGEMLIVDFDAIEVTNLSRTVLFSLADEGKPKAEAAAVAARRLAPFSKIYFLNGDLFYDIGMGFFRHADIIISGLDNIAARSRVGQYSWLLQKPFFDSGMWALGGEIRCFLPDSPPCYECTLSETDRVHAALRRSCTGFKIEDGEEPPIATTVSTTSIIGGMLAQEVISFILGRKNLESGEAIVYNGLRNQLHQTQLSYEQNCQCKIGTPYAEVFELQASVEEMKAFQLMEIAAEKMDGESLQLGLNRDILTGFRCPVCEGTEHEFEYYGPPFPLFARTEESKKFCDNCGSHRIPQVTSSISLGSPLANSTLQDLGVPKGDILAVFNEVDVRFFEFTKDVEGLKSR